MADYGKKKSYYHQKDIHQKGTPESVPFVTDRLLNGSVTGFAGSPTNAAQPHLRGRRSASIPAATMLPV
jgi:hypothetical protein